MRKPPMKIIIEEWDGDGAIRIPDGADWHVDVLHIRSAYRRAYLRDVTGDFQTSQWLMVGVSALMLSITPFLQPYRQRK